MYATERKTLKREDGVPENLRWREGRQVLQPRDHALPWVGDTQSRGDPAVQERVTQGEVGGYEA